MLGGYVDHSAAAAIRLAAVRKWRAGQL